MSEVEKMYKLANVQPQYKKRIECKEGHSIGQPCGKSPCINCDKSVFEDVMPPFTAEKQLELIKVLAHCKGYTDYEHFGKYFNDYVETLEFDEALANIVNDNWQDLTEEERIQIKEILSENR